MCIIVMRAAVLDEGKAKMVLDFEALFTVCLKFLQIWQFNTIVGVVVQRRGTVWGQVGLGGKVKENYEVLKVPYCKDELNRMFCGD